jgi:hypothetical protein
MQVEEAGVRDGDAGGEEEAESAHSSRDSNKSRAAWLSYMSGARA